MLLSVEDLRVSFTVRRGWPIPKSRQLHAVDGVSLRLEPGEAIGIVGESGCGKSTLARAILRLVESSGGEVRFMERSLGTLRPRDLRRLRPDLQMIFQDPAAALSPRMKVGEALAEAISVHKIAEGPAAQKLIVDTLAEVGLPPEAAQRYPHEFSGGQKQRIGIARAMVLSPKLIIADEPVSALDVSVQAQILNVLARLKESRGIAFLFISHDLGVVRHFCDRTGVMYLGRIIEEGDTRAIFDRPAHPYTRLLREVSPIPDPDTAPLNLPLEGEPPSPLDPPSGCRFHPRCPFAVARCKAEMPQLRAFDGRRVACHRAEELPPMRTA